MKSQKDATRLLNSVVSFAKKMLEEHGEFRPYGGYLTMGGKIIDVAVDPKEEVPAALTVRMLLEEFREKAVAGDVMAFALVYMVNIQCPNGSMSDAIQVNLDHKEGYSAEVFYPFTLDSGKVIYGSIFAQAGSAEIFEV